MCSDPAKAYVLNLVSVQQFCARCVDMEDGIEFYDVERGGTLLGVTM